MNKFLLLFSIFFFMIFSCSFLNANNYQILDSSFSFIFETDSIIIGQDSVGSFEGTLYNLSNNEINLEIVRLINFADVDWSSSICIDAICYNQLIDSAFVSIAAGDSTICRVLAWTNGIGSDSIQLKLVESGNLNDNMLVNINFLALYDLSIDKENLNAYIIKILSCYPNPFNSSILLKYKIGESNNVKLDIYNICGKKVKSLVNQVQEPGSYYAKWDGNNRLNKSLPSGAYFLRMQSGEYQTIQKITLIK